MSGGWRSVSGGARRLRVNLLTRKTRAILGSTRRRASPLEQQRTVGDVTTITETIEDEFRFVVGSGIASGWWAPLV